jgi:hypothetical protein
MTKADSVKDRIFRDSLKTVINDDINNELAFCMWKKYGWDARMILTCRNGKISLNRQKQRRTFPGNWKIH